jgi:hypothetical protein
LRHFQLFSGVPKLPDHWLSARCRYVSRYQPVVASRRTTFVSVGILQFRPSARFHRHPQAQRGICADAVVKSTFSALILDFCRSMRGAFAYMMAVFMSPD